MSIAIEPWAWESIKLAAYFAIGWAAGAFVRWLNHETRN